MTLRIIKDQHIGGVPAKDVRDILRKCYKGFRFREDWIEKELYKLSCQRKFAVFPCDCYPGMYPKEQSAARRESTRLIRNLVKEGVIELSKELARPADQGKPR